MFDEDFFKRFDESQKRADENHAKRQQEFRRLELDACSIIPEVGDTVVVAAGLLGMGYEYLRLEAEVLRVGQLSYKVCFDVREYRPLDGNPVEKWIHPALVTDVITSEDEPSVDVPFAGEEGVTK